MSIGENKQQDGKNIKLRLYVVRHGESETNLAKRWTGWMDVSLTGKGREDAKKAGDFLKNIEFDRVLSSDLRRAVQTAETALPGCVPETSPLFREIDLGSLSLDNIGCIDDLDLAMMGFGLAVEEEEEELDENGEPTVSPYHDMDSIEFHLWMEEEVDKEAMRRMAMKKVEQK